MSEKRPEYVTDAMEMMGIDLDAPKQIIQEVSGFTPMFDCVVEQYHDETRAAVHGIMWRFCQMEDGVCRASLDKIAGMIGVSPATAMRHAEALCEDGYFKDLTPDLKNKPHIYADTGKVIMKSKLSAHVSQRNVDVSQRNTHVSQSQLNKDLNKDSKKIKLSIENAIAVNQPVTEEMMNAAKLKDEAPKLFERALGFSKPLPWWSNKVWTEFAEWVCERHAENRLAFGEYNTWRNTPYTKGGMSNTRLRGFPAEFYDSWDMFMMSRQARKTDEARPEYTIASKIRSVVDALDAVANPFTKPESLA